jgi:Fe2+ transport system protein FeoA
VDYIPSGWVPRQTRAGLEAKNCQTRDKNPLVSSRTITYAGVAVKKQAADFKVVEGHCAGPSVCPLSHVAAGTTVCIKELAASPELRDRLRELGLGEEQRIKLLSNKANVICQVCNARVALSEKLAKAIMVEPLSASTST